MISDQRRIISPILFNNQIIDRNGKMGEDACKIMSAAINAVEPYECVQTFLRTVNQNSHSASPLFDVEKFERVFLIGFGKASVPMAKALIDQYGKAIIHAQVITKDPRYLYDDGYQGKLRVYLGDHPVPTQKSIESTQSILKNLPDLTEKDLVLVVISGGGSALFTDPVEGISLFDLQETNEILLNSGADIHEINTIRKHLDHVKGGRLAKILEPAYVCSLILSDVIGDNIEMIASGPTVPNSKTMYDAMEVIKRYRLEKELPVAVLNRIEMSCSGAQKKELKDVDLTTNKLCFHLVGTNIKAAQAAKIQAQSLGYQSMIISSHLTGHTSDVAELLNGIIKTQLAHDQPAKAPVCLIFGGELTVEVKGNGLGGRNQDLVLRMVQKLQNQLGVLFISLSTDGEDGPTDAAGAASDGLVLRDSSSLGLNIASYLEDNNAYEYFNKLGGLIKTGSTGTNVNDLVLILIDDHHRD